MASYCPGWQHQLQPSFSLSNQQEKGQPETAISASWEHFREATHIPLVKTGQMATVNCKKWWKMHLFQAALCTVTSGFLFLREKERTDIGEKQRVFPWSTLIIPICESTLLVIW